MLSFKNYIFEASLLGRTTKYSGSLGAFKQYVELSPNNKIFELEKDAEILDEETSDFSDVKAPDMRSSEDQIHESPYWSIEDDVCYTLKTPPTALLNIKASHLQNKKR